MSPARLASLLLSTTLSLACGPEGDGGTTADASSGSTTEGGSSSGGTTGDSSHGGEACAVVGEAGACVVDGVAGYEFCFEGTFGAIWSPCLTELCDMDGSSRACEGGTQYCDAHQVDGDTVLLWGGCVLSSECEPGQKADCGFEDMQIFTSCILDENGVPHWDPNGCATPLVLSFGDPVEFTPAPTAAADFDIHGGAGVCVRPDWPGPATPWLALDLDKNGSIDGGHELFGSGTRLAEGTGALNGFVALAPLDSDGDGKLSASDARFGELVLWADHDGDRRSSGWEMLPLASLEIVEISLDYGSRRECDAAGNCGVERASFVYRQGGRARVGEVVDVHLACE